MIKLMYILSDVLNWFGMELAEIGHSITSLAIQIMYDADDRKAKH